ILEESDVVVGVDDQAVPAAAEVHGQLVPALVAPSGRAGVTERGEEVRGGSYRFRRRDRAAAVHEVTGAIGPELGREPRVHRVPGAGAALGEAAHLAVRPLDNPPRGGEVLLPGAGDLDPGT